MKNSHFVPLYKSKNVVNVVAMQVPLKMMYKNTPENFKNNGIPVTKHFDFG